MYTRIDRSSGQSFLDWQGPMKLAAHGAQRSFPRVLSLVVSLILLLVVILYSVTRVISARSFDRLERREVEVSLRRATDALDNRIAELSLIVADYGVWDDTYEFVTGNNPDDNLIPDSMLNLRVDFMAVVNVETGAFEGRAVDLASGNPEPVPDYAAAIPDAAISARGYDPTREAGSGLAATGNGILLFATNPITTTDATIQTPAYLVVGRLLDDAEIAGLSELTQLELELYGAPGGQPLPAQIREAIDGGEGYVIEERDAERIVGYAPLDDVSGDELLVLGVSAPRTIHGVGVQMLNRLAWALGVFGAIAAGIVGHALWVQQRVVIERRETEGRLESSELRYRTLVELMPDAVFGADAEGVITFANPRAVRLTGRESAQLVGMRFEDVLTPDSADLATRLMKRSLSLDTFESFEVDIASAYGDAVPVEVKTSPLADGGDESGGLQLIARDITDRRRFEAELVHLASRDHLTGLLNRRRFEEELAAQLEHSRRSRSSGALLWLDIDFFKEINDSLGHTAGDEVLVGVASAIGSRLRADSLLARMGGDEFAIMLPLADLAEAEVAAKRVLEAIRSSAILIEDRQVRVSASMGIVLFPAQAESLEEVLARADLAMYRAKEDGRNRHCVYHATEDWHAQQQARFDWSVLIDEALRTDRFLVYAQPVLDLTSGKVDRHELLIRMESDDGSIIPPSAFLSVAERTGQVSEIDRWMVRRAIDLIAMRSSADEPYRLDVNLSGRAFTDSELMPLIESELIRTGIDPAMFGVEITETAAVTDMSKARQFIETMKRMGCRVALDDFGSGFSSFYYLRNLPIDCLKIDGSFIENLHRNVQDQHVVRAIVELAAGFGISSTAEYVEDEATLGILRSYGVTYAQGFHIARPVPIATHEEWQASREKELRA